MAVALRAGKQPVERIHEVGLRAGAQLHQPDASGGVRGKDREQPVAQVRAERHHRLGEVGDPSPRAVDLDLGRLHAAQPPVAGGSTPFARIRSTIQLVLSG
jgi:hypothetical protein